MADRALDEQAALLKLRSLTMGYAVTRSIAIAAELGIADRLKEGPRSIAALARDCGVLERPLYRILRALSGEGVFAEQEDGRFALTPTAEFLCSDHPKSLRDWVIYTGDDLSYRASLELLHALRTGKSAFREVFGAPLFEYLAGHPESAAKMYRAMSSSGAQRVAAFLEAYDFSGISRLVDIGGAYGAMATAVAKRYSSIRSTCFDMPRAEEGARETFIENGLADRCEFVAGDFFKDVPADADAYLLAAVLHDWDDERCLQILLNCRRRILPTGRLLVLEIVLSDEKNAPDTFRKFIDVRMLIQTEGGTERTESEFRELLARGGFRLVRVVPTNAHVSVIEAFPQ